MAARAGALRRRGGGGARLLGHGQASEQGKRAYLYLIPSGIVRAAAPACSFEVGRAAAMRPASGARAAYGATLARRIACPLDGTRNMMAGPDGGRHCAAPR